VLTVGDIVFVEPTGTTTPAASTPVRYNKGTTAPTPSSVPAYGLRQVPNISGGLVAVDPKNGRVLAMVGGWDFRCEPVPPGNPGQRQPGSAFKPLVYLTAFQNGFTPDSVVDDAPICCRKGRAAAPWNPSNYEGTYRPEHIARRADPFAQPGDGTARAR
jgi:penicillin-binding protein 1A